MARSLWTGSLSFGLVNVPVALFSAVRDLDLHFVQLHGKDGAPIQTRRLCAQEDVEVDWDDIAHGHELDDGEQVVVTDDELEAVAPWRTRTIEIEAFADLDAIDPILFDHPYLLTPTGDSDGARRAYALLVAALEQTDRAAIGRFVLRAKESLVAVRVRDGLLSLTTMRFADEVRDETGIGAGARKPAKAQLDRAVALLDALTVDFDPSRYRDAYRARLEAVVERKRRGSKIAVPRQQRAPAPAADLMAALERSIAQVRGGGGGDADRHRLKDMTRDELYTEAAQADVSGRSSMTKQQLIDALDH
jgi:DNA end-binding protein Ku